MVSSEKGYAEVLEVIMLKRRLTMEKELWNLGAPLKTEFV